jgi:hypothetical protein
MSPQSRDAIGLEPVTTSRRHAAHRLGSRQESRIALVATLELAPGRSVWRSTVRSLRRGIIQPNDVQRVIKVVDAAAAMPGGRPARLVRELCIAHATAVEPAVPQSLSQSRCCAILHCSLVAASIESSRDNAMTLTPVGSRFVLNLVDCAAPDRATEPALLSSRQVGRHADEHIHPHPMLWGTLFRRTPIADHCACLARPTAGTPHPSTRQHPAGSAAGEGHRSTCDSEQ